MITKRRRITGRLTRRGAEGAEQRAPTARAELRPEDGYLQLVRYNLDVGIMDGENSKHSAIYK